MTLTRLSWDLHKNNCEKQCIFRQIDVVYCVSSFCWAFSLRHLADPWLIPFAPDSRLLYVRYKRAQILIQNHGPLILQNQFSASLLTSKFCLSSDRKDLLFYGFCSKIFLVYNFLQKIWLTSQQIQNQCWDHFLKKIQEGFHKNFKVILKQTQLRSILV